MVEVVAGHVLPALKLGLIVMNGKQPTFRLRDMAFSNQVQNLFLGTGRPKMKLLQVQAGWKNMAVGIDKAGKKIAPSQIMQRRTVLILSRLGSDSRSHSAVLDFHFLPFTR